VRINVDRFSGVQGIFIGIFLFVVVLVHRGTFSACLPYSELSIKTGISFRGFFFEKEILLCF
jgi:hypothetical protein